MTDFRRSNFISRNRPTLLALIPLVFLIFVVMTYAVPVPFLDQWDMVPLLQKTYGGELAFHDLWAQHIEHRLIFPQLIMLGLARLTGWNIRYELAANIVLAVGIMAIIVRQIRQTGRKLGVDLDWAIPASALTVFSVSQYENWLWGWQLQMLLNVLAVIGGTVLLSKQPFRWGRFAGAALLGIVATYSFANGAAFWPIGLLILLVVTAGQKQRAASIAGWLGVSILTMWSYWYHYQQSADNPLLRQAILMPLEYAHYVINYLGGIYAQFPPSANLINRALVLVLGLGGPCVAVWLGWRMARRGKEDFIAVLPFLAMSAYSVCGALLTGLGRVVLGSDQAFSSRYCTMVVPMWVSVVVLLLIFVRTTTKAGQDVGSGGTSRVRIAGGTMLLVVLFLGLSSVFATQWAQKMSQAQANSLTGLVDLANPNARLDFDRLAILYHRPEVVIEGSHVLMEHHLSVFGEQRR